MTELDRSMDESRWKGLCRIGGLAALILLVYAVITMILLPTIGGPPDTAAETYTLLESNKLLGLLRLDLLTVIAVPVFYLLYAGLYAALRRERGLITAFATGFAFIGVTLFLTTPSVFALAHLSDRYAAATTAADKALFLAAGEAVIASDMWHGGAGAVIGGPFLLVAGLLISVVMLKSSIFSNTIAYVGLLTNGLDLAHIFAGLFSPTTGVILMAIGGTLYLVWFPLLARRLYQLGRTA